MSSTVQLRISTKRVTMNQTASTLKDSRTKTAALMARKPAPRTRLLLAINRACRKYRLTSEEKEWRVWACTLASEDRGVLEPTTTGGRGRCHRREDPHELLGQSREHGVD